MNHKIFLLIFLLFTYSAFAKPANDFFLKPDDTTSFMNFELHNLAYEAASKKDYKVAMRLYTQLANKGDNRAEYNLGMMYMNGLGAKRKKMDAYKWLRRAAKHGNEEATLYFKEMNERYEKKQQASVQPKAKSVKKVEPAPQKVIEEKPVPVVTPSKPEPKKAAPVVQKPKEKVQESDYTLFYIIAGILVLITFVSMFIFKKSNKTEKAPENQENTLRFKSQIIEATYKNIADYHNQLLQQLNLPQIKAHEEKKQIYYMFLYGMIDYFCQLEKFTEAELQRVVSTHFAEQEGKENVTAIKKLILEGQKDHSMYHYQAAGGISAKAWQADRSTDIMGTLKRLLSEHKQR